MERSDTLVSRICRCRSLPWSACAVTVCSPRLIKRRRCWRLVGMRGLCWKLALEQHGHRRSGRKGAPGFAEQCRQLTQARAECGWLDAGSIIARQQALRDFAQAMANFFAGTHRRPTWRKAGRHEGCRIVAVKPSDVRRVSRKAGEVKVPKVGWVRFRWSRLVPNG